MTGIEFVLLLFLQDGLAEYTVRESLSECLSTKRVVERNMDIDKNYKGSTRWACKKLKVKVDERGNIVEFIDETPAG